MEAVGRLAGGVAHDFNNSADDLKGYAELALNRSSILRHWRRTYKTNRQRGGARIALVRQLLAFAEALLQPKALDLNSIVMSLDK